MQHNLGMDGNATPVNQAISQQIVNEMPNENKDAVKKENFLTKLLKKLSGEE